MLLQRSWKVEAWRQLSPEVSDKLGDVCPAPFASIEALQENDEWRFASPELVHTDEFALACFLGNLSELDAHYSPELFAKAAKMPPPTDALFCAAAHDLDCNGTKEYWRRWNYWWRLYAWVEYGNDAVSSHAGVVAELARHLATTTSLEITHSFIHAKRLGTAMGTIAGLQRTDVLDNMMERIEDVGEMKPVVDFALAFLGAMAKTDGVERFTDAHVDRLGAIAGALGTSKADAARAALVGRIVAAIENPARATIKKRVRDEYEAFDEDAAKAART